MRRLSNSGKLWPLCARKQEMPIKTEVWSVGLTRTLLQESMLPNEQLLEEMIGSTPRLLSGL
jgi:hypothetical protein